MLQSYVDSADRYRVSGWAHDNAQPDAPLSLLILDNDRLVARVIANRYRPDLAEAGIGSGRHGFHFEFAKPLSITEPHIIRVCREADGTDLVRSPVLLEPPPPSGSAVRELLTAMLADGLSEAELVTAVDLMIEQVDRAVQRLADSASGRAARAEHRLFIERWRRRLADGAAPDISAPAAIAHPRALVIDDRLPRTGRDAGSVAILSHISSLQRLGFSVTFVSPREFQTADGAEDFAALAGLGVTCCRAPYYGSVEEVLRRQMGQFDLVYLHRVANAAKYAELARHYCPQARQVYSVADLHHLRLARQAAVEDRPEMAGLAERCRLMEVAAAALADAVITHSSAEARLLGERVGPAKVHMVRWSTAAHPVATPLAQRNGIAFIGGFSHPPNLDAARWLIAEIMPLLQQRDSPIECLLVGPDFPPELRERCGAGLSVLGAADDLAGIFRRVRVTVAPLRYGAGIKGKVIDSLAAGVPCVMTPIAAEGLDLPHELDICIGRSAAEIVAGLHRLHEDDRANEACRKAGLDYIRAAFSETQLDAALARAIDRSHV